MSTISTADLMSALANNYRFKSAKGNLTTEDLFSLPLTGSRGASLNGVALNLHNQITALGAADFVGAGVNSAKRKSLEARMSIVKAVIAFQKSANQAARSAQAVKAEREMLQNLLAEKKGDALRSLTLEEVEARLTSLGA